MKTAVLMILCLLAFSGCTTKYVTKYEYICTQQVGIDRPSAALRVKKSDEQVALAFKDALNSAFEFYEFQVEQNNRLCEELN